MVVVDGIPGWYYCDEFYRFAVDRAREPALFVEAGVLFGSSSNGLAGQIARSGKRIELHLVDGFRYTDLGKWARPVVAAAGFPATDDGFRAAFEHFRSGKAHSAPFVTVNRAVSPDAASRFADRSLDFLMLDNRHDLEHLRSEFRVWTPKMKSGAILSAKVAGYIDGALNPHPGVQQAMSEAFGSAIRKFDDIVWFVEIPS